MKSIRKAFAVGIVLLFCLGMTGCQKENVSVVEDSKQVLIGFAQLGSESGWRIGNTQSVLDAAEKNNVQVMYENANQLQDNQIKAIRSFIAYRVDVIVFSPIVEDGWENVLKEAKEAGIPVIIEDRMIHLSDESLYSAYVGSDFYQEGVRAGEYLIKKLATLGADAQLNVFELYGTIDSTPMVQRSRGFRDAIASEPRIQIIDSVSGDFLISKGKEAVRDALQKYGDTINVLYSHNDCMMYGALEAIEEYGLVPGKDIIIISVDGEQNAINLLKEGKINCVVECTPMLGDYIVQLALDLKAGKSVNRVTYSKETVFTEFDDLENLPPRGY